MEVLRQLPQLQVPELLVGYSTEDDAAVYRLSDDIALVQTVDFFSPVVDDPFQFGAIAVANALSDVYAMGGKPLLALNILCFPADMDLEVLRDVLRGANDKAREAGVLVVGGHTVDDPEPKYGLAVTGTVQPGRQVANVGARPGDALVLTKALGTGIITTAGKRGQAREEVLAGAVQQMLALNAAASEAMTSVGVHACTDITGYGFLGHLLPMARGSGVTARVRLSSIPILPGTWELAEEGIAPGGSYRNLEGVEPHVCWEDSVSDVERLVLCDAQTSGGLLMAVPPDRADALLRALEDRSVAPVSIVGEVEEAGAHPIRVVR